MRLLACGPAFSGRADVVRNMHEMRKLLPEAGVSRMDCWVSKKIIVPLLQAEQDSTRKRRAKTYAFVYEIVGNTLLLKTMGQRILMGLLSPQRLAKQADAQRKLAEISAKIASDAEAAEGIRAFEQGHGTLSRIEKDYLADRMQRSGVCRPTRLMAKLMRAQARNSKAEGN